MHVIKDREVCNCFLTLILYSGHDFILFVAGGVIVQCMIAVCVCVCAGRLPCCKPHPEGTILTLSLHPAKMILLLQLLLFLEIG